MIYKVLIALTLVACAACSTGGGYGPATGTRGFGYSDQIIETGRYRVTYKANSAEAAENGALRRAAELTIANRFDVFTVVARDLEREATGPRSSIGIGGGNAGRRTGLGVGVQVPVGGQSERVTARLEVLMSRGPKPDGNNTYDARSILSNIAVD